MGVNTTTTSSSNNEEAEMSITAEEIERLMMFDMLRQNFKEETPAQEERHQPFSDSNIVNSNQNERPLIQTLTQVVAAAASTVSSHAGSTS